MNLQQKIEQLLKNAAETTDDSRVLLGELKSFSDVELEIIFENKVWIYSGSIFLRVTSNSHEAMAGSLFAAIMEKTLRLKFCPAANKTIPLWGKFSCGSIYGKIPDVTLFNARLSNDIIPIVAECEFTHLSLNDLLIQASELLSEATRVRYAICLKLQTRLPFRIDFYIFERNCEMDDKLNDIVNSGKAKGLPDCSFMETREKSADELIREMDLKQIFYRRIDDTNYSEDFTFELEGRYFGSSEEIITFTVSGQRVNAIRCAFYRHMNATMP